MRDKILSMRTVNFTKHQVLMFILTVVCSFNADVLSWKHNYEFCTEKTITEIPLRGGMTKNSFNVYIACEYCIRFKKKKKLFGEQI